jgi:DNA-binding CsgD family transcriptional regulator/tetratricopeptide (TPR) repeat protein
VLEAAAVIGMRVEVDVLRAVCGEISTTTDECLTAGALVSDGRLFRFRHELARRAVEQAIPAHRAAELHRSALDALLDLHNGSDARIAYHADYVGDAAAALEYAPRAAARASSLGAHTEAMAHYQRAVAYAGDADAGDRARLFAALADEAAFVDRWQESAAARRTAIELFAEIDDVPSLGTQWRRMAVAQWRLCRGRACDAAARQAVEILEPRGPSPELAGAYATLAAVLAPTDERAALDLAEKATELAKEFDQKALACTALQICAGIRIANGNDSFDDYELARELARAANDTSMVGSVFANAHEAAVRAHRFGLAQRYYEDGLDFTQDHEIDTYTSCLVGWHAAAMEKLGRYDEALSLLLDALAKRHVSPVNRLYTMPTLGRLRARRGDAEAQVALDEAIELVAGNNEPPLLVMVAVTRAEIAWLDGRLDDAADAIRDALTCVPVVDRWDRGMAITWARRLGVSYPADVDVPAPHALEIAGDHRGAARAWLALGCPYEAALALADSGEAEALHEAARLLDVIGATATLKVVSARMREHGVKAVPRGVRAETRANPFRLTRREHEVLDLLSTGMTNSEIAAELVLSERTVDNHVSAVLAKMGVSSRHDAARKADSRLTATT